MLNTENCSDFYPTRSFSRALNSCGDLICLSFQDSECFNHIHLRETDFHSERGIFLIQSSHCGSSKYVHCHLPHLFEDTLPSVHLVSKTTNTIKDDSSVTATLWKAESALEFTQILKDVFRDCEEIWVFEVHGGISRSKVVDFSPGQCIFHAIPFLLHYYR